MKARRQHTRCGENAGAAISFEAPLKLKRAGGMRKDLEIWPFDGYIVRGWTGSSGSETEYGCLMSSEELRVYSEVWPAKVKNYLFNKARAGAIDLHYRDYEEPPGNGGFLLNGGRLYLDMGHIEYASPECLHLA